MPVCVALQPDGTLVPTGEAIEACTGYVLYSGSENAVFNVFTELFTWPAPEVLASWFVAAFGFVLVMNAAGYITGCVVKMLSTERD